MKKIQLTLIMVILVCVSLRGQNFSQKFGQVGKDEIELKQHSKDMDAEAVVLFDIAKSHFANSESSFDLIFERATRIKILSEAGIKWAEVKIPVYQEGGIYERVYDLEAITYNYENGKLMNSKLNLASVYDEKINKYWNVKKFALPNVKPGSIVEFRYKISSQYLFNLRDWEFQWKIPVVHSEYQVKMIPFYDYTYVMQGAGKFDSHETFKDDALERRFGGIEYNDMVNKFVMKDIPAFKGEEFISSAEDYIIKLDFQLAKINYPNGTVVEIMSTWDKMIEELLKHGNFGKYVKKSEKLAEKLIKSENLNGKTEKDRFNQIVEWVKQNYSWDEYFGKYASKSPKKLVDEKNGNCADINLFTIAMLKCAGIDAHPVLISTRDHGKIYYNYPYSHSFNYVIILANVDGQNVLTDATDLLSLNDRIPTRCINDKGLIIRDGKSDWIGLSCLFASEIVTELDAEFSENMEVNASIKKISTEYDAYRLRQKLNKNKSQLMEELEIMNCSVDESSLLIENQKNKEKPFAITYRVNGKTEIINDKVYFQPFMNEVLTDNPLKQKERTYPIDMVYPVKRTFKSRVKIPEGYKPEVIPKDQKIKNQHFELNYSVENLNDEIVIVFDYNFKNAVYNPTQYGKIKFYFNEIVKRGNEKIVFSKP